MEVLRRYKTFEKRTLVIYDDKKPIAYIRPYSGWFSIELTKHSQWSLRDIDTNKMLRSYVMKNLYWLLGRNCDLEEWNNKIYCWDIGRHVYGVPIDKLSSMFFEGEKDIALKSFGN